MTPDTDDQEIREDLPETDALAAPDEKAFWNTYSPRFEAPISYVGAALILASFIGLFSLILFVTLGGEKIKPGLKMGMSSGEDDFGEGEAGNNAGVENPVAIGMNTPTQDDIKKILPDPDRTLPEVKDDILNKLKLEDPNATTPISNDKAAQYAALDQKMRDAMLGIGQQKGSGKEGNTGEGNNPNGKGTGTGSDSTRARTLRWTMRFTTAGGQDYLDQLKALGAKIVVPLGDGKAYIFRDLGNPQPGVFITEKDWSELSGLIQFGDITARSNREMGEALGTGFLQKGFWAYFPRSLEAEMSKKETGYQQRRSEDIEETVFEVSVRGGKYEILVKKQTLKK